MVKLQDILQWLFAIFIVYLIIEIIRKILGGSLGFEELVITLLAANLGYSFSLNHRISSLNSRVAEHIGWHKGKDSVKY